MTLSMICQEAAVNLESTNNLQECRPTSLEIRGCIKPEDAERLAKLEAIGSEFQKKWMMTTAATYDGVISMVERMECIEQEVVSKAVLEALLGKQLVLFGIFGIVENKKHCST